MPIVYLMIIAAVLGSYGYAYTEGKHAGVLETNAGYEAKAREARAADMGENTTIAIGDDLRLRALTADKERAEAASLKLAARVQQLENQDPKVETKIVKVGSCPDLRSRVVPADVVRMLDDAAAAATR